MFSIEVKPPKGELQRVQCQIDSCTIGKADDNLIVVRGWSVGKRHATIHRRNEGFFVEDHGALGATEVNGKFIEKQYGPLKADDVIRIGDYNLKVLLDAPQAGTAAPAEAPAAARPQAAAPSAAPAHRPEPKTEPPSQAKAPKEPPRAVAAMTEARRNLHKKLISQMDLRRLD
ncbi:MAG: FHA domain-containing protein, partial [Betaproteobacteria bacterium]|nr:FHA domain-containing protein [Betaproteobacteria bacterium]